MNSTTSFKFRLFRDNAYFIITKQKTATRYLGAAFSNEGHEVTISIPDLKIEHIDLLGASKKTENLIEEDWKEIVAGSYSGTVLLLFRNPLKRFLSAQVQDFSDVIANVNSDVLTNFAFTSYFNRKFPQNRTFLTRLYKYVETGEFDKIVLDNDGSYDIDAYNLFKDLLYDWLIYRHQSHSINTQHSEHYLYGAKYLADIAEKCDNFKLLNIDDPTADLKNVLQAWTDIDKVNDKHKIESAQIKKIFGDLVKENTVISKLVTDNLLHEEFFYNLLKNHKNLIKNNITL